MSGNVIYADSSALVKLIITEAETPALRRFLSARTGARLASSEVATTEVMRAVLREAPSAMPRAHALLASLDLVTLTRDRLQQAGLLQPPSLRSLDAHHLVAALALGSTLSDFVAYDQRMAQAAAWYGLPVGAPS
jgi:predicted nucleic acid-binding protein